MSGGDRFADLDLFTPLSASEELVLDGEREVVRRALRVFRSADGFEVGILRSVLDRAFVFAREAAPREMYAHLVGRLLQDDLGRHVVVDAVVPDDGAEGTPGRVQTTVESEHRSRTLARRLFPDGVILGWLHTHPQCTAVFSSTDKDNQATWTQPHSIGIVLSLLDDEHVTVYRGPFAEQLVEVDDPSGREARTRRADRPDSPRRVAHAARHRRARRLRLACLALLAVAVIGVTVRAEWRVRTVERRVADVERSHERSSRTRPTVP